MPCIGPLALMLIVTLVSLWLAKDAYSAQIKALLDRFTKAVDKITNDKP